MLPHVIGEVEETPNFGWEWHATWGLEQGLVIDPSPSEERRRSSRRKLR